MGHGGPLSRSTIPGFCTRTRTGNRMRVHRVTSHVRGAYAIAHTSMVTILITLRSIVVRTLRKNRVMELTSLNAFRVNLDKENTRARSTCSISVVEGTHVGFHPNVTLDNVLTTLGCAGISGLPIGAGRRRGPTWMSNKRIFGFGGGYEVGNGSI